MPQMEATQFLVLLHQLAVVMAGGVETVVFTQLLEDLVEDLVETVQLLGQVLLVKEILVDLLLTVILVEVVVVLVQYELIVRAIAQAMVVTDLQHLMEIHMLVEAVAVDTWPLVLPQQVVLVVVVLVVHFLQPLLEMEWRLQ
jgi:hypothetical protein